MDSEIGWLVMNQHQAPMSATQSTSIDLCLEKYIHDSSALCETLLCVNLK